MKGPQHQKKLAMNKAQHPNQQAKRLESIAASSESPSDQDPSTSLSISNTSARKGSRSSSTPAPCGKQSLIGLSRASSTKSSKSSQHPAPSLTPESESKSLFTPKSDLSTPASAISSNISAGYTHSEKKKHSHPSSSASLLSLSDTKGKEKAYETKDAQTSRITQTSSQSIRLFTCLPLLKNDFVGLSMKANRCRATINASIFFAQTFAVAHCFAEHLWKEEFGVLFFSTTIAALIGLISRYKGCRHGTTIRNKAKITVINAERRHYYLLGSFFDLFPIGYCVGKEDQDFSFPFTYLAFAIGALIVLELNLRFSIDRTIDRLCAFGFGALKFIGSLFTTISLKLKQIRPADLLPRYRAGKSSDACSSGKTENNPEQPDNNTTASSSSDDCKAMPSTPTKNKSSESNTMAQERKNVTTSAGIKSEELTIWQARIDGIIAKIVLLGFIWPSLDSNIATAYRAGNLAFPTWIFALSQAILSVSSTLAVHKDHSVPHDWLQAIFHHANVGTVALSPSAWKLIPSNISISFLMIARGFITTFLWLVIHHFVVQDFKKSGRCNEKAKDAEQLTQSSSRSCVSDEGDNAYSSNRQDQLSSPFQSVTKRVPFRNNKEG